MSVSSRRVIQNVETKFNPSVNKNWLAGGEFYNSTLAGNRYFDPTTFGAGKLFGLNEVYLTKQSLINKGFITAALNAPYMDMLSLLNGGTLIALYDYTRRRQTNVVVLTAPTIQGKTAYILLIGEGNDLSSSELNDISSEFGSNIAAMSEEMTQDSVLENTLEAYGYSKYGSLGYAAGGVIGGLLSGKKANIGANIAEAVVSQMKSLAINTAMKAMGISSFGVAAAVGIGLGMLVDELAEMAMGLDNSFGFGGELTGFDDQGRATYTSPVDWSVGIKAMLPSMVRDALDMGWSQADADAQFGRQGFTQDQVNVAMAQMDASAQADNPSSNNSSFGSDSGFGFGSGSDSFGGGSGLGGGDDADASGASSDSGGTGANGGEDGGASDGNNW